MAASSFEKSHQRPLPEDAEHIVFSESEMRILESFQHHSPSVDQVRRIERLRWAFQAAAVEVITNVVPGPDRERCLQQTHEAMMTALKAVVLDGEGVLRELREPATFVIGKLDTRKDSPP